MGVIHSLSLYCIKNACAYQPILSRHGGLELETLKLGNSCKRKYLTRWQVFFVKKAQTKKYYGVYL